MKHIIFFILFSSVAFSAAAQIDPELLRRQPKTSDSLKLNMDAVMKLSPRTIDGYRDALFEKLGIKSRVGLVLFAIKNHLINV